LIGGALQMTLRGQRILAAVFGFAIVLCGRGAIGQTAPAGTQNPASQSYKITSPSVPQTPANLPLEHQSRSLALGSPAVSSDLQPLLNFKDSDIKFNLGRLMNTLRDSRHEGWVLAAYPDPKTSRPLIGAGFSLDVPVTQHPQRDPLNPYVFLEPSSPQLWQAAGLDSAKLQSILDEFDRELAAWQKKKYRKKIRTHELTAQLTEEEATQLLRISTIQAVHNARAYCRFFDQLTASQQMALSQLVFQMGVNLEEFTQFLGAINDPSLQSAALTGGAVTDEEHWKVVQSTLIQSDWARRYSTRAIAVIAMFDPEYDQDPLAAERRVRVQVHPLVVHHRKKGHTAVRTASAHKKTASHAGKS
jgi:hypothetical protein